MFRRIVASIGLALGVTMLVGCAAGPSPTEAATAATLADELIFYDWEEDMPQSVLDAFTEEYGVKVTYIGYETQEEALANVRADELYDVVVIDNDFLPQLTQEGLLAEIDPGNVPNFKNISANFRDMAYDPGNRRSVPFNWGTTGLVVRSDLLATPVTQWADLWELPTGASRSLRDEPRGRNAVPGALEPLQGNDQVGEPREREGTAR